MVRQREQRRSTRAHAEQLWSASGSNGRRRGSARPPARQQCRCGRNDRLRWVHGAHGARRQNGATPVACRARPAASAAPAFASCISHHVAHHTVFTGTFHALETPPTPAPPACVFITNENTSGNRFCLGREPPRRRARAWRPPCTPRPKRRRGAGGGRRGRAAAGVDGRPSPSPHRQNSGHLNGSLNGSPVQEALEREVSRPGVCAVTKA